MVEGPDSSKLSLDLPVGSTARAPLKQKQKPPGAWGGGSVGHTDP